LAMGQTTVFPNTTLFPKTTLFGTAAAAWTTNSKTCGNNQGGSTTSCTWSTAVTTGQSQFCWAIAFATGVTFAVTDSDSESFTAIGTPLTLPVGTGTAQMFWFKSAATSITSVTLTPTPSGNFPVIMCNSATDSGASPAFDGSVCSGSGSTNPFSCSGALALAAQDYVMEGCYSTGSGIGAGSGFTQGSLESNFTTTGFGLFTSSVTPACTNSGVGASMILAGAWKP
jgi:hypothetical protein